MLYEVIAPDLSPQSFPIIWGTALAIAEGILIVVISLNFVRRILRRIPPRPQPDSPNNVIREWQLRYINEESIHLVRTFVQLLITAIGIFIVWAFLLYLFITYIQ